MSYAVEHGPRPHRITVDELIRMDEAGLFAPDARVELIEGVIVDMAIPGNPHSSAVDLIAERFFLATHGRAVVRNQGSVRLSDDCLLSPDLALLRFREDRYRKQPPAVSDIHLIIEVADSSVEYDFVTKQKVYARYGIPEVWIFNVQRSSLHFFRSRSDFGYSDESSTRSPGVLPLPSLGLTVDLSGLVEA